MGSSTVTAAGSVQALPHGSESGDHGSIRGSAGCVSVNGCGSASVEGSGSESSSEGSNAGADGASVESNAEAARARTRHPTPAPRTARPRMGAMSGCPGRHRPRTPPTGHWPATVGRRPWSRLLMGLAAATHPSPATDRDVPAMDRRRTRVPRVDPRTSEARGPRRANRGRPDSRMVADPKDRSRARPGGYSAHAGMIPNARNRGPRRIRAQTPSRRRPT